MPRRKRKVSGKRSLDFEESPFSLVKNLPSPVFCSDHPVTANVINCEGTDVPWVSPQFPRVPTTLGKSRGVRRSKRLAKTVVHGNNTTVTTPNHKGRRKVNVNVVPLRFLGERTPAPPSPVQDVSWEDTHIVPEGQSPEGQGTVRTSSGCNDCNRSRRSLSDTTVHQPVLTTKTGRRKVHKRLKKPGKLKVNLDELFSSDTDASLLENHKEKAKECVESRNERLRRCSTNERNRGQSSVRCEGENSLEDSDFSEGHSAKTDPEMSSYTPKYKAKQTNTHTTNHTAKHISKRTSLNLSPKHDHFKHCCDVEIIHQENPNLIESGKNSEVKDQPLRRIVFSSTKMPPSGEGCNNISVSGRLQLTDITNDSTDVEQSTDSSLHLRLTPSQTNKPVVSGNQPRNYKRLPGNRYQASKTPQLQGKCNNSESSDTGSADFNITPCSHFTPKSHHITPHSASSPSRFNRRLGYGSFVTGDRKRRSLRLLLFPGTPLSHDRDAMSHKVLVYDTPEEDYGLPVRKRKLKYLKQKQLRVI